jgi:tetratricopeptide (TPR) repeat protein
MWVNNRAIFGYKDKTIMSLEKDLLHYRLQLDEALTFQDFSLAEKIADLALHLAEKHENLGEMFYFKAQLEMLEQNYTQAIIYLSRAVSINTKAGAAFNDMALCLTELGMIQEALLFFDKGISVEPDYPNIYHNKGWLLSHLGHYSEAIVLFSKALSLDPQRAVTYENLGFSLENLGRMEEAVAAYQKALDFVKPHYPGIREEIQERMTKLRNKQRPRFSPEE